MKAREIQVPEATFALDTLASPTWTYTCELATSKADRRSAEGWARAVIEGAPRLLRWFVVTGWIVGLRLRLGPRRSTDLVAGWEIVSSTPTAVILAVGSFALSAHLVVQVEDSRIIHSTFVRYDRWPARFMWTVAAPIHRRVIPYLLEHAART